MTKQTYVNMLNTVHESHVLFAFVKYGGKLLTYVSYAVYPLLVAWLFWRASGPENVSPNGDVIGVGSITAWAAIIVPGVSFVLLSFFRDRVNAPRPYEVFETPALVNKKTRGHSFPSRHVFSAFIIATTAAFTTTDSGLWPWVPVILYICAVLLAVTRVLVGVHFPKDVVAGALAGVIMGVIGFTIM